MSQADGHPNMQFANFLGAKVDALYTELGTFGIF